MRTQPVVRPIADLSLWGQVGQPSPTNVPHVVDMPAPFSPLVVHADSITEAQETAQQVAKLYAVRH